MKQRLHFLKRLSVLFVFFGLMALPGVGWGQLFIQDFSSSNTVSDYVSSTPNNSQFNSISSSGAGTTVSIASGALSFARTANAGSFSRTTDFSPVPTTLQYKVTISVSGNTTQQTTAAVFQVGSGFGTANSAENNTNTYARFAINFTATDGTWQIRDITNGTNSGNLVGSQDITWILNNSGFTLTYLSPSNQYEQIQNDRADIWAGTTKLFDDVLIQTPELTMADLKFAFTVGTGTITVDNFLIDPIPVVWLNNQSSTNWNSNSNWGFGSVPTDMQNVIIPSGGDQPTVNNDIATPAIIGKLTINSGAMLTVGEGKAISISGTLTNNAAEGIVLLSPESHGPAGSLIIEGSYSGSGTIKAERHILSYSASANGWHLLSSPVNNPAIATATNLAPGAQDDFYGYDEVTYEWLNYKVPGNGLTTMDNGKGFLVAYQSGSTKHMIGTPNTSSLPLTDLSITNGKGNGWHLLGNPFQSAITWNSAGWNLSGIATTAKLMTNTGGFEDLSNGGIIPAMQGFWVQAVAASNMITIPTTARVHNSTNWLKTETNDKILLVSHDDETGMLQKSIIHFNADATPDYDLLFDSRFMAWYAPTFYSIAGTENLSTNTLPELTDELVIPLGFKKNVSSNFSIELAETIENQPIYLTDLKTNTVQKLSENPIYTFTSAEGDDPNRFLLHFGLVSLDEKNPVETLQAYAYNNRLFVNNSLDKAQLAVYDVQGRLLLGRQLSEGGLQSVELKMPAGVYIVRLHNSLQSKSVKIIVQ